MEVNREVGDTGKGNGDERGEREVMERKGRDKIEKGRSCGGKER